MSRCQGNRGVSFQKCQIALLSSHFSDNPVSLPLLPPPPPSSLPSSPEEITGSVSFPAPPAPPSPGRVPALRVLFFGFGDAPVAPPAFPAVPGVKLHGGDLLAPKKLAGKGWTELRAVCPGELHSPAAFTGHPLAHPKQDLALRGSSTGAR